MFFHDLVHQSWPEPAGPDATHTPSRRPSGIRHPRGPTPLGDRRSSWTSPLLGGSRLFFESTPQQCLSQIYTWHCWIVNIFILYVHTYWNSSWFFMFLFENYGLTIAVADEVRLRPHMECCCTRFFISELVFNPLSTCQILLNITSVYV